MLSFCAILALSSAIAPLHILYKDAQARREIMKNFESDQRATQQEQLQAGREWQFAEFKAELQREIDENAELQAKLRREIDENAELQAELQKEIAQDAKTAKSKAAAAAVFSDTSDEKEFSEPVKSFGLEKRATRHFQKAKQSQHVQSQKDFAEEQLRKRESRNAQDAEPDMNEYVFDRDHRNPRLRKKAEKAVQRAARQAWREENDRAKQEMLFGEGGWYGETAEEAVRQALTEEDDNHEMKYEKTADEDSEMSEQSTDVAVDSNSPSISSDSPTPRLRNLQPNDVGHVGFQPFIFSPTATRPPKKDNQNKLRARRSNVSNQTQFQRY